MTFQDDLRGDLDTVFNLNEFAETVELNEVTLTAIVAKVSADTNKNSPSGKHGLKPENHSMPLMGESVTLYFKRADYPQSIPKHTGFVRLNGRRYKVQSSIEKFGMVRLDLVTDRG